MSNNMNGQQPLPQPMHIQHNQRPQSMHPQRIAFIRSSGNAFGQFSPPSVSVAPIQTIPPPMQIQSASVPQINKLVYVNHQFSSNQSVNINTNTINSVNTMNNINSVNTNHWNTTNTVNQQQVSTINYNHNINTTHSRPNTNTNTNSNSNSNAIDNHNVNHFTINSPQQPVNSNANTMNTANTINTVNTMDSMGTMNGNVNRNVSSINNADTDTHGHQQHFNPMPNTNMTVDPIQPTPSVLNVNIPLDVPPSILMGHGDSVNSDDSFESNPLAQHPPNLAITTHGTTISTLNGSNNHHNPGLTPQSTISTRSNMSNNMNIPHSPIQPSRDNDLILTPDDFQFDADDHCWPAPASSLTLLQPQGGGDKNTKTKKKKSNVTYPCETCGRLFKHKSNLKTHRRIHDPDAPTCQYCGKKFARESNLKQHLRYIRQCIYTFSFEVCYIQITQHIYIQSAY